MLSKRERAGKDAAGGKHAIYDKKHSDVIANSLITSSARFRDGCKFLQKCEKDA